MSIAPENRADGALSGQVAVVTGAGRGIGREIALLLAREGASVVVNDLGSGVDGKGHDAVPAALVVDEIRDAGGKALASGADISRRIEAAGLIEDAISAFGRIDIVINNAGILRKAAFCEITEEEWSAVMRVNLDGAFFVSQAAARAFVGQKHGVFVHMTSTAGLIGATNQAHYCASKLAITSLSRSIALELHEHGVRSNCISPIAATRMTAAATGRALPAAGAVQAESPAAVAPLAAYLAGKRSAPLTGQIIGVRGNDLYLYNQSRPVRVLQQPGGWTPARLAEVLEPAWRGALTPLERTRDVLNWPAS